MKTGDVTVGDALSFSNKVERISVSDIGGKMLFVLGTISNNAVEKAKERDIELWDLAKINAFRQKLRLENLSV